MMFPTVVRTELAKLRRSPMVWITFAVYAFMIIVAGCFLWMAMNPGTAERLGLMGQKATLAFGGQPADWPTFLAFVVVMGGLGGLIMSAAIAAYVFGREYAEGTAKNLLALPIRRSRFVLAKTVVAAAWLGVLTAWMVPVAWLVGSTIGLPGLTWSILAAAAAKLFAVAGMSFCCSALVAWVAVETRGYFAPLGYSIGTLVLASVFGHTGWAPWVPWSIVGLYTGAAGPAVGLGWPNLAVIALTFLLGILLTIRHEVRADNGQ